MVSAKQVARALDEVAPVSAAMEWDNTGLLLDCGNETGGVLFALDVTQTALDEAKRLGCGILVTHHPVMLHAARKFSKQDMLVRAAHMEISLVASHTNFDAARGGVNDVLCNLLALRDVRTWGDIGRGGTLNRMNTTAFASYVKEKLSCAWVGVIGERENIQKVAVIGGAGGGYAQEAASLGYDALVTGEIQHHEALAAQAAEILVVCAGHYKTERPSVKALCKAVGEKLGDDATCFLSESERDPVAFY